MSQNYPRTERRQDQKIDDLWRTIPIVRQDILEVKDTVEKHDKALFGYQDEHGKTYPGIAQIVQWIPDFARKAGWGFFLAFLSLMGAIVANFAAHYYGWVH